MAKTQYFKTLAWAGLIVLFVAVVIDFEVTWESKGGIRNILTYNVRDAFFLSLFVLPAVLSHLVTIWGHYYRADSHFQESIVKVAMKNAKDRKRVSIWERHDPWIGFSTKYWIMVLISVFFNAIWFVQPLVAYIPSGTKRLGRTGAIYAYVAFGTGYAAMGACGMLLLLVLRRSMFQAIGYTYADLLPLHRWMGVAFVFWSTIHTIFYTAYYIHFDAFWDAFNFDGNTRGPQNMIALVAYAALCVLGITAIPQIRRRAYVFFITMHRVMTVITFVGTLMHYPYYIIWYYCLPSMCLYLADRFIPKIMQELAIAPEVVCSFDKEADIATVVVTSRNRLEPLKPYYPGDYINLQIPELSTIYHPFTIGSYWAEDPYSMTLYIRTFQENESSWTHGIAKLCPEDGSRILVKGRVDGVFGDRDHDYFSNEVIVIFAAGAAITTFMSLLKSMAAQIDATSSQFASPSVTQVHLICTFRYESELYAYGDFLHRITHDPRFTTWLCTTLYVSRPDKDKPPTVCSSGQCGHEGLCERVVPESAQPAPLAYPFPRRPANYGAAGVTETKGKEDKKPERVRPFPGCCPESTGSCLSNSTVCGGGESSAGTRVASAASLETMHGLSRKGDYDPLPTFPEMSSATLATVHAKKDLVATTLILFVPLIVFSWSRSIVWDGVRDGEERWCKTTFNFDQRWTNHCLWAYALMPGVFHLALAMAMGYAGLWAVRCSNLLHSSPSSWKATSAISSSASSVSSSSMGKGKGRDASRSDLETDTLLSAPSVLQPRRLGGLYPEAALSVVSTDPSKQHTIPFKRGRMQVHYHIQELKMAGIGREDSLGGASRRKGGVLVFGGGPEAFVEMIEESCKKAEWDVDFCAETWAP
ncbi:hypothetical protein BGZ92_003775 [Podila epicladia]|nr:hypothetical protein BGZ92_003775 [Podila epicladia]